MQRRAATTTAARHVAPARAAVGSRPSRPSARVRARRAGQEAPADEGALRELAGVQARARERLRERAGLEVQGAHTSVEEASVGLAVKVRATCELLERGLLERETEVRLLVLAALCGEHLLLLGPPGTAKSELARRLSKVCRGRYFERLLTRFSVPEELFGPLSMKGLEDDRYERQIEGYLPTAEVAFVDEIFKANSAILNALLTLLNERLFDNGTERLRAPLLCLVGASNELPESEELDALYDRFMIRKEVRQVSGHGLRDLARLAAGGATHREFEADSPPLALEDFAACRDRAVAAVEVPDRVLDLLVALREHLQDKCEPPVYVSDRRFTKCVTILQVAAYANGQAYIDVYDCLLLQHLLGQRPGDDEKVRSFVLDTIANDPALLQAELTLLGLFGRAIRAIERGGAAADAELEGEVAALAEVLFEQEALARATLDKGFPSLTNSPWFGPQQVAAAIQVVAPQLKENRAKVEGLLEEALLVQEALRGASPGVLERLLPKRLKQYEKGVLQKQ